MHKTSKNNRGLEILEAIVLKLREHIKSDTLTKDVIDNLCNNLKHIEALYDYNKYPNIPESVNFYGARTSHPTTLAEAFIWKHGKWQDYLNFVDYFSEGKEPINGIVFWAYAQHLKDRSKPIFDQHSLRALWAIYGEISGENFKCVRNCLVTKKNEWEKYGKGGDIGKEAYHLYCKSLNQVASHNNICKSDLDKLLMPLGGKLKTILKPDHRLFSQF